MNKREPFIKDNQIMRIIAAAVLVLSAVTPLTGQITDSLTAPPHWFRSGTMTVTRFNGERVFFFGGEAGWYWGDILETAGTMEVLAGDVSADEPYQDYSLGGMLFSLKLAAASSSGKTLYPLLGIRLGFGLVYYNTDAPPEQSLGIFGFLEPFLSLRLRLSKAAILSLNLGRRQSTGSNLAALDALDLSTFTYGLSFMWESY